MGQQQEQAGQAEDYTSERGPVFDAAVAEYEAARQARDALIDHPDKSVPVDVYKGRIRDAHAAVDQAHRKVLAAWA